MRVLTSSLFHLLTALLSPVERPFKAAMTAFFTSLLFCTPAGLAQQKDDWPQFRGNTQLTGVSTSAIPKTLKLLWTYDAGEPVESSAAIADGVVYIGSGAGYLSAVDLATGKPRWKYKVSQEGVGESSAAVRNGAVYIGDLAGVFHAVDVRTGKALWTYKTGAEIKSSPVVVDDRVLIGSYDGTLYCLSVKNGAVLWKVATENYVHGTPAVADGIAYISGCDEVFRGIRISDGKELFEFPSGAYTGASPALTGAFAYFGTFSNEVVAANLKLKKTTWRYENPDRHFPFYSSAAITDGKVILGGRDKLVYCFNAATGKPIWTFTTRSRIDSSPAIAGGRIYIGSNDGRFYVLDQNTGAKIWEYETGSPLSASPAIAGGRVVIGAQDGRVYCFG
jgi:outer membrane protein assembly factor BamB